MIMHQKMEYIFFSIMFLFCNCQPNPLTLKLNVNEEVPINFVVGNIQSFVSNNFYHSSDYTVTHNNQYFNISNKNVVVNKKIDLENLCDDGHCCSEGPCKMEFEIVVMFESNTKNTFKIEIEIKDINDNNPYFKTNKQQVSIHENSDINAIVRIEAAIDRDVTAINRVQRYKFQESTNTFHLDSSNLEELKLLLQKSIDYETQKSYTGTLYACENSTSCSTHCIIQINIEDENDNDPKFIQTRYEKSIMEDFPIGGVVLQVQAVDIDGPKFNKTKYTLANKNDRYVTRFFEVSSDNGKIILKNKLYMTKPLDMIFKFKIKAIDAIKSITSDTVDYTDIIINVEDVNDNKPVIKVNSPFVTENNLILEIKIKENELPRKLLSILVSDKDLKDNGKVTCLLKDENYHMELKPISSEFYDLWSTNSFDYEKDTTIKTVLECRDHGTPSQVEYRTVEIQIEDVNEFPPVFQNSEYTGSLNENSKSGFRVLQVQATDKDRSAELIYSIDRNVLQYFSIDKKTGVIETSHMSFDRELISMKEFYVTVTDDKDNPKTASALVKIEILDINDNYPIFVLSSLQFYVMENQQIKTRLDGKLNATDRDYDRNNNFVKYEFVNLYDHNLVRYDKPVFQIKPVAGEIESLIGLDRETHPNWTITLKAYDNGNPIRYTLANATIYVRDLNDNHPEWIYPRPNFRAYSSIFSSVVPTINISEITEKNKLILKLQALDKDESDAGRVSYFLYTDVNDMFSLNETTGELITLISPLRHGTYQIKFSARDHGIPPLSSDTSIIINVQDNGRYANINLTIIIGMVAITVLISAFLIVAIICVRRRPRFQKYLPPSSGVQNDNGNPYYNQKNWPYHTEENPMPPDNESFMFLPPAYCASPHSDPMTMQVINNSRPASRMDYHLTLPSSNNFNIIDNSNGSQISQNVERLNGTLRSNNGFYGSNIPTSLGIVINGQELDGDSADSGKGASEVDLRLQHQLNLGNRNYPTLPFVHYSTATTSFGHYNNMSPNQYYSINNNSRVLDSRFLTINPTHLTTGRRVASPSNSNCQCFMLPEDEVIQINQDNNSYSMTTFSNKPKMINHEKNCIYNGEELSPPDNFYEDYTYGESSATMKDYVVIDPNDLSVDNRDIDKSFNNLTENTHNKNLFSTSDKNNPEKNFYSLGLAN